MDSKLLQKYNVPGPRYTSYPTVPYWQVTPPSEEEWKREALKTFEATNASTGISLYIHLPFCESLCTFCGCNKRITINHAVESPYIRTLLKEWQQYLEFLPAPRIKEIHLGGGTPTFFSAGNLKRLIEGILEKAELPENYEFSFEAHPNVTTPEQLQTLYDLGFRRVSFGVQDFDPKIQEIINRKQSYEVIKDVTLAAKETGYTSINYDLVYGLPLQDKSCIIDSIEKTKYLRPDRIAFYSYAHVPWISPGQRRYTEEDLPRGEEKRALYELGREMLEDAGYVEIGMDHFALKSDSLYKAVQEKTLHRNFMGYSADVTQLMIGLGVSSISDAWGAFIQNNKKFEEYVEIVESGKLPIFRGHIHTKEDLVLRRHILNIMCHFETSWKEKQMQHPALFEGIQRMKHLEEDGLVQIDNDQLKVTPLGNTFIRNICMALDQRMWKKQPETELFSQTI